MNTLILIVIISSIVLIIFTRLKLHQAKKAEKKYQDEMNHEASQKISGPERKLHEEEKKRWEDNYYKRH